MYKALDDTPQLRRIAQRAVRYFGSGLGGSDETAFVDGYASMFLQSEKSSMERGPLPGLLHDGKNELLYTTGSARHWLARSSLGTPRERKPSSGWWSSGGWSSGGWSSGWWSSGGWSSGWWSSGSRSRSRS